MQTVSELGEFGLIQRLAPLLTGGPSVVKGIGDDCAVVRVGGRMLLVSSDLSLEHVHFRQTTLSPIDIGYKAAASSLSDIAAMGGNPLFCQVSLACPGTTPVAVIEGIYEGLQDAVSSAGAIIIGGDTASSPEGILIDVTVIGEVVGERCLMRRGAHADDLLVVTGPLGLSAAGFVALEHGEDAPELISSHARPQPRFAEGQWLCEQPAVHAMIDISDGLAQDAGHLAEASGIGVNILREQVPIAPVIAAFSAAHELNALALAISGGEDYELAFALDPAQRDMMAVKFRQVFHRDLRVVGTFTEQWEGVRLDGEPMVQSGFDHFPKKPQA